MTIVKNIRNNFESYMLNSGLKSIVLGVSGGIDSALCAVLLRPVMDKLKLPLIGISIPASSNKDDEIDRADAVGKSFCTEFYVRPINNTFGVVSTSVGFINPEYDWSLFSDHKIKIFEGNIKARLRMIHLYGIAGLRDGMVISTDNLTEYYLGFWTLHGDVGDYSPIQNLWKTEVYETATYLLNEIKGTEKLKALQDCINANATDGLGVSSTSLEQIGLTSWKEVDEILQAQIRNVNFDTIPDISNPVIKRYVQSKFKRNNPYSIPRGELFK
jgi:NAD+ synthase